MLVAQRESITNVREKLSYNVIKKGTTGGNARTTQNHACAQSNILHF